MVYLKNIIIIFIAFITSYLMCEILLAITINHPVYDIDKQIIGLRKSVNEKTDIYKPYSRVWTTEGGYKQAKRNNIGLTGTDVIISDSTKYIFVIGSSYIQANQVDQEDVSTSIFQSEIGKDSKYQVLNLGEGMLDPYDAYFKIKYYSQLYKPEYIFLVAERTDSKWFKRHDTLDFKLNKDFGKEDKSTYFNIQKLFRENSPMINLFFNGLKVATKKSINDDINKNVRDTIQINEISNSFMICLHKYYEEYNDKFVVVSIMCNDNTDSLLSSKCKVLGVNYFHKCINYPANKINGIGHFNEKGNEELGRFYSEIFYIIKNQSE